MGQLSRRVKEFIRIIRSNRKWLLVKLCGKFILRGSGVMVLIYILSYLFVCTPLLLNDFQKIQRNRMLCMAFHGGIGNQFFHYAFAYSKAREKNLELIIQEDNMLTSFFNIKPNTWEIYGYNRYSCWCFWRYFDGYDCGYDPKFEDLPNDKDLSFYGYFQSWRYWQKYEKELREMFQFKSYILNEGKRQLQHILASKGFASSVNVTLIGLHIRKFTGYETDVFGKQFAPKEYLIRGMNYYRERFHNCLFIVCANDILWAKEIMPKTNDIYIVEGNSGIVDMALLTLTNHTLMTVGTYGWMIAWLTKGTTLYYKYPDKPGSPFSKLYSNYSDHFYPGWIPME